MHTARIRRNKRWSDKAPLSMQQPIEVSRARVVVADEPGTCGRGSRTYAKGERLGLVVPPPGSKATWLKVHEVRAGPMPQPVNWNYGDVA